MSRVVAWVSAGAASAVAAKLALRDGPATLAYIDPGSYWNKIRVDFPATFARMAAMEREIGATVLRDDGPLYLDELDPERGRMADEPAPSCSLFCEALETGS